ncbi:hypothetical protein [Deinococcus cellulosilyticus]|uniref:Uncharacterized protein n=1 Tax=Deinococcus cellulosilyticus (strain DSM 18568 / NBRC 106333 / KACC 11606 / 5516J-15) TaxID=1223518 RepID=A0A511N307_DEIC1|nr:hypothetical protein [Deinococcus cellulosilyticus]GEM46806.1 hypothetical protein DC3_24410 [Deinococcus cellulosilyticus NBRC 106333 = KACC 11606]
MMHQLNLHFSQNDLEVFQQSGLQVALVKSGPDAWPSVTWIAFSPYMSNVITWEENYEIYTSQSQLQPGSEIIMDSTLPAQPGRKYMYQNMFLQDAGPQDGGTPDRFQLVNRNSQMVTAGLAQGAEVNGQFFSPGPVGAVQVFPDQSTFLTPANQVLVFATPFIQGGTVTSQLPGNALRLDFQSGNPSQSVRFDLRTGGFVPDQMPAIQ